MKMIIAIVQPFMAGDVSHARHSVPRIWPIESSLRISTAEEGDTVV